MVPETTPHHDGDWAGPWALLLALLLAAATLAGGALQRQASQQLAQQAELQGLEELAAQLAAELGTGAGLGRQGPLQARLELALPPAPAWAALELVDEQGRVLLGTDGAVVGSLQPPAALRLPLKDPNTGQTLAWLQAVPARTQAPVAPLPWTRAALVGLGAGLLAWLLARWLRPGLPLELQTSLQAAQSRQLRVSQRLSDTETALRRFAEGESS